MLQKTYIKFHWPIISIELAISTGIKYLNPVKIFNEKCPGYFYSSTQLEKDSGKYGDSEKCP